MDVIWKLINPDAKEKKEFEEKIEKKAALESMLRLEVTILVAMKWLCKANRISECSKFASHIKLNDKKTRMEWYQKCYNLKVNLAAQFLRAVVLAFCYEVFLYKFICSICIFVSFAHPDKDFLIEVFAHHEKEMMVCLQSHNFPVIVDKSL